MCRFLPVLTVSAISRVCSSDCSLEVRCISLLYVGGVKSSVGIYRLRKYQKLCSCVQIEVRVPNVNSGVLQILSHSATKRIWDGHATDDGMRQVPQSTGGQQNQNKNPFQAWREGGSSLWGMNGGQGTSN